MGEQRGAAAFPRVPGLLFCTVSSSNRPLQRLKEVVLPKKTPSLARRHQEKAHPQHNHTLSQLSSVDPLSHGRTLPSLPCPASPPLSAQGQHRASLRKAWVYGCCQKQQFKPLASIHLPAPFALTPSHHPASQRQSFPWKRMQRTSKGHSETDIQITPRAAAKHMGTSRRSSPNHPGQTILPALQGSVGMETNPSHTLNTGKRRKKKGKSHRCAVPHG